MVKEKLLHMVEMLFQCLEAVLVDELLFTTQIISLLVEI